MGSPITEDTLSMRVPMIDPDSDLPKHDQDPPRSSMDYGTVPVGAITDEELGGDDEQGSPAAPTYDVWDPAGTLEPGATAGQASEGILGRFSRSENLVVLISSNSVEVLAPRGKDSDAARVAGDSRLIELESDAPVGKELARFLVSTLKEHGVPPSAIRLALADDILPAKIIEVPNLQSRDLHQVMSRRISALIDSTPEEVAFSALALDGPDQAERRWLVHPMLAKPLTAFQMEMRGLGWQVRDVVPARTAPFLSAPAPTDGGEENATLVVVFDRETVGIGLVTGGSLTHLSTLPGSLDTHLQDSGARSLVQELRGVDAFWRRSSRGEQVTEILILGAVPSALERLAPPIRAALGDVRVAGAVGSASIPIASDSWLDRALNESRIDLLRAMRTPRAASLDLSLPLRPRGRSILAVAMSSLVVCTTLAMGVRSGMEGLASSISTEARVVEAASADLEELRASSQEVAAVEAMLLADTERLTSLEGIGVSASPIIGGLRRAFGDGTRLLSMRAMGLAVGGATISSDRGEVGSLLVRGIVVDAPGETMAALGRLRAALAQVPGVVNIVIEPPSLTDRGPMNQFGAGSRSLRFLVSTRLVPAGSEAAYMTASLSASGSSKSGQEPLPGAE